MFPFWAVVLHSQVGAVKNNGENKSEVLDILSWK